jgi:DNA repair protein RadA/Sms
MSKVKTSFFCQSCGTQHAQWQGQCNSCKQWNTLTEEVVEKPDKKNWKSKNKAGKISKPLKINQIEISSESRINTGDAELNRVLGGGIIPGALMLLGGEPGIGKSTLLLQIAMTVGCKVLYVSGEESQRQIKIRSDRMDASSDQCYVLSETKTQNIFSQIENLAPDLVVIDSVQTLHTDYIDSSPGSVLKSKNVPQNSSNLPRRLMYQCFWWVTSPKMVKLQGPRYWSIWWMWCCISRETAITSTAS